MVIQGQSGFRSMIRRRAAPMVRAAMAKSFSRRVLGCATRQVSVRSSCWAQVVRSMASRAIWIEMALEAASA